jgi:transcriptional regulator with XRE-family HTH domain
MRLDDYIEDEGLTYAQFANMCDISARALYRYAKHERVPREEVMRAIIHTTGGAVQPNDFFDLSNL